MNLGIAHIEPVVGNVRLEARQLCPNDGVDLSATTMVMGWLWDGDGRVVGWGWQCDDDGNHNSRLLPDAASTLREKRRQCTGLQHLVDLAWTIRISSTISIQI